jgi:hypothetical protein
MRTIDKIITKVDCRYGAPMGRSNVFPQKYTIVETDKKYLVVDDKSQRIFDCIVPLINNGDYDKENVYWGFGGQLRVEYTKDLSYIKFYRKKL